MGGDAGSSHPGMTPQAYAYHVTMTESPPRLPGAGLTSLRTRTDRSRAGRQKWDNSQAPSSALKFCLREMQTCMPV